MPLPCSFASSSTVVDPSSSSSSSIKPYRLIEDEEEIKCENFPNSSNYPSNANDDDNSLSMSPANGQIHINFGLKYLLIAIDKQPIDQNEKNALKLGIIDSKMTKSKWFNIERIGQDELYEELERVLQELKNFTPYSLPFQNKVSKKEAPDYYDIVREPMDLGLMYKKLKSNAYQNKNEFIKDLNLIYSNCYLYNSDPNSPLRVYVDCLREKWNNLMAKVPDIQIRSKDDLFRMLNYDFSKEVDPEEKENRNLSASQNFRLSCYQRYLKERKKRLDLPFGEQPACIRSGEKMGKFNEEDQDDNELMFFSNAFPPSNCLQKPVCFYWRRSKGQKHDYFLGESVNSLIANVNAINMIRHLKGKIEQIKDATAMDFGKPPISEGLVQWNSHSIQTASFRRLNRGRADLDVKHDVIAIIKRFIALFCANFGYQSVQMSALNFFVDIFYEHLYTVARTFALFIEEDKNQELNLTCITAQALRSLEILPKDLLLHLRNGHKKHCSKVQEIQKSLEKQYFSLLKVPSFRENDSDIEEGEQNEDFLLVGEVDGDDLGLDMLCLKELGLPSNIPKELLRPKAHSKEEKSTPLSTSGNRYSFVPFAPINEQKSLIGVLSKYHHHHHHQSLGEINSFNLESMESD